MLKSGTQNSIVASHIMECMKKLEIPRMIFISEALLMTRRVLLHSALVHLLFESGYQSRRRAARDGFRLSAAVFVSMSMVYASIMQCRYGAMGRVTECCFYCDARTNGDEVTN